MGVFIEYGSYDALGLAELVRKRDVTALELVDTAIERIERVNPELNAVITTMFESARRHAGDALPDGPFAGVPFLLKDLLSAYAGVQLAGGSRFRLGYVPGYDSELVRRYKHAGLVVVGKTNTPEQGLLPVTEPEVFGPTHNPWRIGLTAGGSSGGSGAAVAAGIVPMAHGGDGGGSIRIPAACCGVFGFKPSRGRTPCGPDASEQWQGYAIEHGLTRTVRDSAALLDAASGIEQGSWHSLPRPKSSFLEQLKEPVGKLRIAFSTKPLLTDGSVHADCAAAVRDVAALCTELGHEVDEGRPEIDGEAFVRDYLRVIWGETAATIAEEERLVGRSARPGDFEPATWLSAMLGREISAADYALALRSLSAMSRAQLPFFERYDVLLTPTLGMPPLPHHALRPGKLEATAQKFIAAGSLTSVLKIGGPDRLIASFVDRIFQFVPFTPIANVTGQPSMSVPLNWNVAGLPIGSMFTGRFGDDGLLLRLAAQLEEARPWRDRRPAVHTF